MQSPVDGALPVGERIATLDILRGFALLGILIMNMPGFSNSFFVEADGSHLWPGRIDQLAENGRDMLFSGKFNSMFSLLFGIGFTIQYARMEQRDPARATLLYLRRLAVLAVLGLIHATIFWTGDVLHIYALLGLLLVFPLRRASARSIVMLIVLCLLYPVVSGALRLMVTTPEITAMLVSKAQAFEASNNAAYGHGTFMQAAAEHMREFAYFYGTSWSLWGSLGFWVQMSLTMLLGLLAGRQRWVQRIPELMPQVRRLMWVALAVGLGCGAAFTLVFPLQSRTGPVADQALRQLMLLDQPARDDDFLRAHDRSAGAASGVAETAGAVCGGGTHASTNYLMQTAICTTLFYGWGFGLWGKVGPAAGLALAVTIFVVIQVPWSRWWLKRHERGPLEALWARLTYGPRGARPLAVTS